MHFNVLQVINNRQELGFDFKQSSGKVNGIDMDHDGMLDVDKNGEPIATNIEKAMMPPCAYRLNRNLDWRVAGNGSPINSEGKKLTGATVDGSCILEGEEIPEGAYAEDENALKPAAIELSANRTAAYAKGNNGMVFVCVTKEGDDIISVEVIDHNETVGVTDPTLEGVPAAIVESESPRGYRCRCDQHRQRHHRGRQQGHRLISYRDTKQRGRPIGRTIGQ